MWLHVLIFALARSADDQDAGKPTSAYLVICFLTDIVCENPVRVIGVRRFEIQVDKSQHRYHRYDETTQLKFF